jgi:CelD/BcsL family acetyltransferase involved in cellulose biosynthesis
VLAEGPVRGFLGETTRAFAASGRLRGVRLELDGRLVAVFHGLLERGRLFAYLCGFDPAFAAASPGAVLLAHVAEEAIREGARALDLLRGRERYKYDWGAVDRAAVRRVLAPAARGAAR